MSDFIMQVGNLWPQLLENELKFFLKCIIRKVCMVLYEKIPETLTIYRKKLFEVRIIKFKPNLK